MFYFFNKIKFFFDKRIIYWLVILTLCINFYLWYLIYNFIDFSRNFHVLHYNAYFGIDLLGASEKLLNIPIIGIIILVVNFILAYIVYIIKKDFIIPYFLLFTSLFINLELIIYLVGVIGMEY